MTAQTGEGSERSKEEEKEETARLARAVDQSRWLIELQEMSTAVTKALTKAAAAAVATVATAAVAMASSLDNNTVFGYDMSSADVLYQWSAAASGARLIAQSLTSDVLPTAAPSASASFDVSASERVPGLVGSLLAATRPTPIALNLNDTQFLGVGYANATNDSLDYASYQQQQEGSDECRQLEGNNSYWNLTCDSPLNYAQPLYGYCMPFLLFMTIISNSLIVLVLSKKSMATPTNFVLMGK